jgi:hypothetical protein
MSGVVGRSVESGSGRQWGVPSRGQDRMSRTRERCPRCSSKLVVSRFDTAFRLDDSSERLCFGIPGSLCQGCVQLFVDPDLLDLLDLDRAVCTFAIESDLVLQEQAWSSGR